MSSIKRISPSLLQVGMYISSMEGGTVDSEGKLRTEGLLTRQDTIDKLLSMNITEVLIDTDRGIDCHERGSIDDIQITSKKAQSSQAPSIELFIPKALDTDQIAKTKVPFEKEFKDAKALHTKALGLVSELMNDVKMGRALDVSSADQVATSITESIINNQNALASLMRLRSMDTYLFQHSMNVSVLMGILARSLGYQDSIVKELVLGAFLHDLGKIRVPDGILHKPGKLDDVEWQEMKRHVNYGIEALNEVDGIPQVAKDICAQHHEKLDGTGYPFGLNEHQLSRHCRMASVVDVYDAITADRCYHDGMEPTIALKKMLSWTGDHLDRDLVYQLIRCLGVYPPGSFVELESGHVAMVQEHRPAEPNKPVVQMAYDTKRKKKLDGFVVDLRKHTNYGVVTKAVNPEVFGLKVSDFLNG